MVVKENRHLISVVSLNRALAPVLGATRYRSGRAPPSAQSQGADGRCHNYRTDLGSSARSRSGGMTAGIRCARRSGASSRGERTGPPVRELTSPRMLRGMKERSCVRSTGLPRRQPNSQRRYQPGGLAPGSPAACYGWHQQDGRCRCRRARPPGDGRRRPGSPPRHHLLPRGVERRPGRHRGRAVGPARISVPPGGSNLLVVGVD